MPSEILTNHEIRQLYTTPTWYSFIIVSFRFRFVSFRFVSFRFARSNHAVGRTYAGLGKTTYRT